MPHRTERRAGALDCGGRQRPRDGVRVLQPAWHARMLDSCRRGDGTTRWEDAEGGMGKALIKLFTGHALLEYMPGQASKSLSAMSTACTTAACTAN